MGRTLRGHYFRHNATARVYLRGHMKGIEDTLTEMLWLLVILTKYSVGPHTSSFPHFGHFQLIRQAQVKQ